MKGIMFSNEYGLEDAVLRGEKTRTWREDKKPRYKVGEIVAIKQCYRTIFRQNKEHSMAIGITSKNGYVSNFCIEHPGWVNKMFVKPDLMPHRIRIKSVMPCRLQCVNEEECLREGIKIDTETGCYICDGIYLKGNKMPRCFKLAKDGFRELIDRINGRGYWGRNPYGYAYEFELIK